MTIKRENVAALLPILTAYGEGKEIELNVGLRESKWIVQSKYDFSNDPDRYRIKPEPETLYIIYSRNGAKTVITTDKVKAEQDYAAYSASGLYGPYTLKSYTENL